MTHDDIDPKSSKRLDLMQYFVCGHCLRTGSVHIEERLGIRAELHERGGCLLRHPAALRGPFASARDAALALRSIQNNSARPAAAAA